MPTMLLFQNFQSSRSLQAAVEDFLTARTELAWVLHVVHHSGRALLLLRKAKYKQREEVDFNRLQCCDLVFIKLTGAVVLPSAGAQSSEQTRGSRVRRDLFSCKVRFQGQEASRNWPD